MPPTITRRLVLALAAATFAGAGTLACAQQPSSPLKLIVPFPAGGTADVLPRIVVENKSGAGGNIGAEFVSRSDPDGTTFVVSPPGPIAINHHLYKSLPFDATKWMQVTVVATVPNVLAVSNKLPVKNVEEFVAYLKANPRKVSYASQGNGSTSHLTAAMFMQLTGTEMIHIPYKGTAPALVDIVGGNVDVFFDNISSSAQFHTGGKLKILAVADEERSQLLPQVPTFVESDIAGMVAVTFFSMVAPPGTPKAAIDYAHKQFSAALLTPDVQQKFALQGVTPAGWTPARSVNSSVPSRRSGAA